MRIAELFEEDLSLCGRFYWTQPIFSNQYEKTQCTSRLAGPFLFFNSPLAGKIMFKACLWKNVQTGL